MQVTPIRRWHLVGLEEIKPRLRCNYVVKGWLDRNAVSVLYGESNSGKTFFALDLAMHVAAGEVWQGNRVRHEGAAPVLYLAAEGGAGLSNRLAALKADKPKLGKAAQGRFHLLPEAIDLFDGSCGLGVGQIIEAIDSLRASPSLIVIDTMARAMGTGDENSAADMARFLRSVDALRKHSGAHVMIVHHTGKDGAKGARGSSALRAAVDTEIALSRSNGVTTARTSKQRDMIGGATFAYTLRPVHLGSDDDGDPVASAVIEATDGHSTGAESAPRAPVSDRQRVALEALDYAIEAFPCDPREHPAEGTGLGTPKEATVPEWRSHCDRLQLSLGTGDSSRRTAFHKVKKALLDKGLIEIRGEMVRRVAQ